MFKVNLSFKSNELYLYTFVKSKLSASIYIKSLILADYNREMKELAEKEVDRNDR